MHNLDDIICVFKEADPNEIHVFVARELHKLPPVLFDHVYVTQGHCEAAAGRGGYQRAICHNRTVRFVEIVFSCIEESINVKKRRGFFSRCFVYHSGPMGLSPMCNKDLNYTNVIPYCREQFNNQLTK